MASIKAQNFRDVLLEFHFEVLVLVLVLEGQVLVDMWQVLYFYCLIFKQYA